LSAPTWARVGHVVDCAVDGDDGDAGIDGFLHGGRHATGCDGADQQAVDVLGDSRFDIGGLLGHLVLSVERVGLDVAQLGRLVLHLRFHEHEERERHGRQ